eukprot:963550-Alexandrium_andersonii.AAC.1
MSESGGGGAGALQSGEVEQFPPILAAVFPDARAHADDVPRSEAALFDLSMSSRSGVRGRG